MSENLDIKDLSLLTSVSDTDRILMTKASGGHSAAALTVKDLKEKITGQYLTSDIYADYNWIVIGLINITDRKTSGDFSSGHIINSSLNN